MNYTTETISTGVDWITCSAEEGTRAAALRQYGMDMVLRSASEGNKVRYFKRGPYVGAGTSHCGFGEWHGRGLVEVHGSPAHEAWTELLALSDKVSRLDLEVTVRQTPYNNMLAIAAWAKSLTRAKMEGKPPKYRLQAERGLGSTLYIGQGASRFQARMYEKGLQEPLDEWKDCWRYELQARRERAVQVAGDPGLSAEPAGYVARLVHSHFTGRGVRPIFEPGGLAKLDSLPAPIPDDDRSIRWLASSARPVIERLTHGSRTKDVLLALGLPTNALDGQDA